MGEFTFLWYIFIVFVGETDDVVLRDGEVEWSITGRQTKIGWLMKK